MIHVIDANNLAGKLNLLGQDNFDEKLIEVIKGFYQAKKIAVFLVFDSLDPMGDRIGMDYLTVVYTPRDSYYSSADDKIVELVEMTKEKQVRVITDDLEIIEKVEEIGAKSEKDIQILKATKFAEKIEAKANQEAGREAEIEDQELNNELLEIWQEK